MPIPQRRSPAAVTLSVLLALGATVGLQADEWSRFRGPNGVGIVPDTGYPTEFGAGRNLKWRSRRAARQVVAGPEPPARVPDGLRRRARSTRSASTAATGRLVWERSASPARHEDAHVLNEPSAATPVTDGENVYVFFRDLGVISL